MPPRAQRAGHSPALGAEPAPLLLTAAAPALSEHGANGCVLVDFPSSRKGVQAALRSTQDQDGRPPMGKRLMEIWEEEVQLHARAAAAERGRGDPQELPGQVGRWAAAAGLPQPTPWLSLRCSGNQPPAPLTKACHPRIPSRRWRHPPTGNTTHFNSASNASIE